MTARWQIHFFGNLYIRQGERELQRLRTQKTAALLALLALKNAPQRREDLCAALWPDAAPELARNSLSAALSTLRREFGNDFVCADRFTVGLAPGAFTTDIEQFLAALKEGDAERATKLYHGHFLPSCFEEPLVECAREFEEKARLAFDTHLEQLEAAQRWDELISEARRGLKFFPHSTSWQLALMRAHRALCHFEAALEVFKEIANRARRENEPVPDAARHLARQIRREREEHPFLPPELVAPRGMGSAEQNLTLPQNAASDAKPNAGDKTSNVPSTWTLFFGRDQELAEVTELLRSGERLVTLSGMGGTGKTRLIIEVARRVAPEWPGRVHFVPLAALSSAELFFSNLRDALGLEAAPDLPPLEQLVRFLRGQKVLLLLDNFEQLVEGAALSLQTLREKLPEVTFLVTSRVLLNLPGEREYAVAPLPTPAPESTLPELEQFASAALFCDRAHLQIGVTNAPAIGAICRRLDGIPLALELAAARAKVLSPNQILERLGSHPDFLQSRERGVPERHRTLRATIEWSVDLLPEAVRGFFARLCVFRGTFSLDSAEKLCSAGSCQAWATLDLLEQLRAHSLLLVIETPGGTRYRLLEMLREWGESVFNATEWQELRCRHLNYFTQLAQDNQDVVSLLENGALLRAENANFRAALGFALQLDDAAPAARLVAALRAFWESNALNAEGCEWVARVFEKVGRSGELEPQLCADLNCCGGAMAWYSGDYARASFMLEKASEAYQAAGDEIGEVRAQSYWIRVLGVTGREEQERDLGYEVIALARKHNDLPSLLWGLIATGWGCLNTGLYNESVDLLEEAIVLARQLGDARVPGVASGSQIFALILGGRAEEASTVAANMVASLSPDCDPYTRAFVEGAAAMISLALGDIERARHVLPDCARRFHAISTRWEIACVLSECGNLAAALGDFERAALIYGGTEALRRSSGHIMLHCMKLSYEGYSTLARGSLGEVRFDELWTQGLALSLDEVVALTQERVLEVATQQLPG
jgi:predicted ATPase/DNA-binding SARP family transcriptional activator